MKAREKRPIQNGEQDAILTHPAFLVPTKKDSP